MVTGAQIIYGMRSWYEMASELRWYASNSTTFWNAEAANRTDTILANCRTKRQKLDTVLAYIQKNINWGGSSVRPDAATMLRKGEGNALTMSALARAMMREGGIDVQLVMMHSADDGYFDERFVAPSELYMPGVIATIDSTEYTMLPYYKGLSPNLLPDRFKNTDAMKVTEAGTQEFTSTPAGSPETNKRSDAYNIAIGDDGALKVEQDIELVGEMAYLKRREIEDLDPARLKAEMKDVLDYSDGDILDFTYEVVNRDDYGLPLTIRLRYTIDNLVTVTPDEVVFQTGGLFSPASRNKNKVDVDKRESPIRVYGDETLDKRITIHFPASWKLATKLPNVEKSNMYGEVKGSYALSDGMLDVTHHRVLRRGTSGPEKFSDLLAIIGTRSVLNVPSLVFKRSTE
jgi:hypothetical protein